MGYLCIDMKTGRFSALLIKANSTARLSLLWRESIMTVNRLLNSGCRITSNEHHGSNKVQKTTS